MFIFLPFNCQFCCDTLSRYGLHHRVNPQDYNIHYHLQKSIHIAILYMFTLQYISLMFFHCFWILFSEDCRIQCYCLRKVDFFPSPSVCSVQCTLIENGNVCHYLFYILLERIISLLWLSSQCCTPWRWVTFSVLGLGFCSLNLSILNKIIYLASFCLPPFLYYFIKFDFALIKSHIILVPRFSNLFYFSLYTFRWFSSGTFDKSQAYSLLPVLSVLSNLSL